MAINDWLQRKSPAANAEQEVGAYLLGAMEVVSAYADVLERGKPIYALSIEFSEADLPPRERFQISARQRRQGEVMCVKVVDFTTPSDHGSW